MVDAEKQVVGIPDDQTVKGVEPADELARADGGPGIEGLTAEPGAGEDTFDVESRHPVGCTDEVWPVPLTMLLIRGAPIGGGDAVTVAPPG